MNSSGIPRDFQPDKTIDATRSGRQYVVLDSVQPAMTGFEPGRDVFEAQATFSEQDDQVVHEVGGLIDRFLL